MGFQHGEKFAQVDDNHNEIEIALANITKPV